MSSSTPAPSGSIEEILNSGRAVGRWQLDPGRSTVEIKARAIWGLAPVRGAFQEVAGRGQVAEGGAVSGELRIRSDSIDTKNPKRDKHLKSADFFDVGKHPQLTVYITAALPGSTPNRLRLEGEIEVLGVRRPVVLDTAVTLSDEQTALLVSSLHLDRRQYGLTWNRLGMTGNEVTAHVVACFVRSGP